MGRRGHSKAFKEAVVTKIVNREEQTLEEVCREEGVALSSAGRWVRECGRVPGMINTKSSRYWSAEEKLKILFQSHALKDEELGSFLRQEGLHSQQLSEWRAEILTALDPRKSKTERDSQNQKIRQLEKDLHRKDKALAEASALLILQKKVNLIWGNKEEDEK